MRARKLCGRADWGYRGRIRLRMTDRRVTPDGMGNRRVPAIVPERRVALNDGG